MPILAKLLLRDAAIVAGTLLLWHCSRSLDATHAAFAVPVAVVTGVMTAVCGFLVHEWGHLIGARAQHCIIDMPTSIRSLFLFQFDPARNSREQYLALSCGGFIASGAIVALLLATLSFKVLADQVALSLSGLGVLATFVLEVPPAWRVYKSPARLAH